MTSNQLQYAANKVAAKQAQNAARQAAASEAQAKANTDSVRLAREKYEAVPSWLRWLL